MHSLHVWSPVSGPVCVLAQSTIVTLLSLPWLGFAFSVRAVSLPPAASGSFGLRWPARLPPFSRVGAAPSTWVPLLWPGCVGFLLLCLPSGCGHPFGSLVSFVTIDRQRRFPLEGFFFWVVASHSEWCRSFSTSSLSLSWLLVAGACVFP